MNDFTPGPWHVGGRDRSTIYDKLGQRIANSFEGVMVAQRSDVECANNARLIALAPELLAIAQKLAKLREGLENGNSSAEWAATELAVKAGEVVARATGVTR